MTHFGFPYRIGADGLTATADDEAHVRGLIEQVLFTRRGERVHRPEFGAGVADLVFAENSPEMAAAAQHMVMAALQQWLSDRVEVRGVESRAIDNMLAITVRYRLADDSRERSVTVERTL